MVCCLFVCLFFSRHNEVFLLWVTERLDISLLTRASQITGFDMLSVTLAYSDFFFVGHTQKFSIMVTETKDFQFLLDTALISGFLVLQRL